MSATTSATTGRRYGLERVCRTWERSRSALYARRARVRRPERGAGPGRRGPTPALSDAQLLAAIRSDLVRSPFQGEGHRKVHARLRILDDIRVSRTRVLRVMRAQGLLSPHRGRQGEMKAHDGTIVTSAPDVMWGTDGVRVFTADDGWVWTFAAVDHWNAECVGWHVCKVGNRFAALEPVAQGLRRHYGSVEADVARGLALRMDHGSQYLSDHFLNQLRYWGIHPSFGFLEEPETNGVAERWNRTLKEQAVYGRVFQNLADVRAAVAEFVERYNQCWRLEKLAYRTPLEAREEYELRHAAHVAQTCVQETGCGSPWRITAANPSPATAPARETSATASSSPAAADPKKLTSVKNPGCLSTSNQLQADLATHSFCRALQRFQCHRFIVGVQEPVEGGAAGVHPPCHFGLAQLLLHHGGFELACKHPLHRGRRDLLVGPILTEEIIEG